MKRADYIIIGIIALLLAGAAIWYFVFYKKEQETKPKELSNPAAPENNGAPGSTNSSAPGVQSLPTGSLPLQKGDKNQLVALLQKALNYLGARLDVDGDFGSKTEAALKAELGGTTKVTLEVATVLANKINAKNSSNNDPIAAQLRATLLAINGFS